VIGKLSGCVCRDADLGSQLDGQLADAGDYLLFQEAATQREAVVGPRRDVEGARLRP
jgi:hypothetical protein